MKESHLSDQDIQRFVFDLPNCKPRIISHITGCSSCKNRTLDYQQISESIQKQPSPTLDFDLNKLVLSKIQHTKESFIGLSFLISFTLIICLSALGFTFYYFKETISIFLTHSATIPNYFIISLAILILLILYSDMISVFNKKIKLIKQL